MAALVENLTTVGNHWNWTLLFARQPEPDLEFTEEELDQTTSTRAPRPLNPRKKPKGGRTLFWLLLLVLVGGSAYMVSEEPELLMQWIGPYLDDSTTPPVVATKPNPAPPVPAPQTAPAPANQSPVAAAPQAPAMQPAASPGNAAPAPVTPPAPAPQAAATPNNAAPAPTPAAPVAAAPAAPAMTPPQAAAKPPVPAAASVTPMFGEGQKVTLSTDATIPSGNIPLYTDATGSKPGPLVRAGATLSILDGSLQPNGWMLLVRTDEGVTGWISEKRLRLKS